MRTSGPNRGKPGSRRCARDLTHRLTALRLKPEPGGTISAGEVFEPDFPNHIEFAATPGFQHQKRTLLDPFKTDGCNIGFVRHHDPIRGAGMFAYPLHRFCRIACSVGGGEYFGQGQEPGRRGAAECMPGRRT